MVKEIIKCSANWCQPCKSYAPIFHQVSENEKYKDINFIEVDIEKENEYIEKYEIKSIPTTIILDENNNVLKKVSGLISATSLETIIDNC